MMACVLCNGCPSGRRYRNHWGCGRAPHQFRDAREYNPHIHTPPRPCVSTSLRISTGCRGTRDPAGMCKAVGTDVGRNGNVGAICSSSSPVIRAGSFCPAEARFASAAAVSRRAGPSPSPGTQRARTASLVLGGRLVLGGQPPPGHVVLGGRRGRHPFRLGVGLRHAGQRLSHLSVPTSDI